MAADNLGVFLGPDLELSVQLRWAVRLARARGLDLVVLHWVEGRDARASEIPLDGTDEGHATTIELRRAAEEIAGLRVGPRPEEEDERPADDGRPAVCVQVVELHCPDLRNLRQLLLAQVKKSNLKLCTIVRKELGKGDPELVRERRLFLRHVPCEVVHCSGFGEEDEFTRVLVPVATGPHAQAALRLARDVSAAPDAAVTALRVNPEIGPDAERVGSRRLDALLRKYLGKDLDRIERRVVVDDQIARGIQRVWNEGDFDLIVTGASRIGFLGSRVEGSIGARVARDEPRPPVAIVSAASPLTNRFLSLMEEAVTRVVPQIDRDDRVALVDRVQSSSQWDFDFFALIMLSTLIAAIGLIQNSAAVVIGAMLVAPLMTPLLGLGLALVQGNPVLARISVRAVGFGLLVSLLVGLAVGLLTPGFVEPTREMLGRGGPGLLDLFVAFASGLAAAYASSRPGLLAALPGVAIAAALVPPIATSGLALSLWNLDLALNALLLFTVNMVTIVLATVLTLWLVGLRGIKKISRWRVRAGAAMLLAILALGVYLSVKPKGAPVASSTPDELAAAIRSSLGDDFVLADISIAYDELGTQLVVLVSGEHFAPEQLVQRVRAAAREHFNKPVRVRLLTMAEGDGGLRGVEAGEPPPPRE